MLIHHFYRSIDSFKHSYKYHFRISWVIIGYLSSIGIGTMGLPSYAQTSAPAISTPDRFPTQNQESAPSSNSSTPAQPSNPTLNTTDRYLLGAGDRLQIDVFNSPDYSREYQVLSDGSLNLPLVGTVFVGGLTIEQAAALITERYQRYILRPSITLVLLESRPLQIAVSGEVNRPGSYNVSQTDLPQNTLTVTQAIQLAGGITQSANIRVIQVRRPQPDGLGDATVYNIDLWQLLQDGNLSQDLSLQDGDSVIVPTATALNPAEVTTLASASFSPDTITVYIAGEVDSPGAIQVAPNTPLNQALLASGGFNEEAVRGSVDLIRLNPDGTVLQRRIPVNFSQGVNETANPALRNNDTIVVRQAGLNRFSNVLDTLLSPISGLLRILNIFP